jgi:hypothetical protein
MNFGFSMPCCFQSHVSPARYFMQSFVVPREALRMRPLKSHPFTTWIALSASSTFSKVIYAL